MPFCSSFMQMQGAQDSPITLPSMRSGSILPRNVITSRVFVRKKELLSQIGEDIFPQFVGASLEENLAEHLAEMKQAIALCQKIKSENENKNKH